MVGQYADIFKTQVNQHLGAHAGFVLDHALAGRFAIELASLVEMDLRHGAGFLGCLDAEAAASMVEIQEYAAVFLGYRAERPRD